MKDFIRLFRDSSSDSGGGLASAAEPFALGIGALQTGVGIVDKIINKGKQKNLLAQRRAYQTPQEIYQILQATESNAQSGFDPTTLAYLTNQTDQAFSSSVGTSLREGGDPNDLSALFSQKLNSIMKIGSESHQQNLANFSAYLNSLGVVADNRAAEQKSQQDILKDKLQAVGANLNSATQDISGGLNTILSTLSASDVMNLYNPDGTPKSNISTTKQKRQPYRLTEANSLLPNGLPMGSQ